MEDLLASVDHLSECVLPQFPELLSQEELIKNLHRAEARGKRWKQGWDTFFWLIGSQPDVFSQYCQEPWVLPELLLRTQYLHGKSQLAALSARYVSFSRWDLVQSGNLRLMKWLNLSNWSPHTLLWAIQFGNFETFKYLWTLIKISDPTSLLEASLVWNQEEIFLFLLEECRQVPMPQLVQRAWSLQRWALGWLLLKHQQAWKEQNKQAPLQPPPPRQASQN